MSIAATLASQCLVMFAVMGLGCLLVKLGMLSPTTTRELGSLLLNVVFPVVIVRSFWGMYTPERLENLVFTMVLSALALGLAMLIARLVFPRDGVLEFAAAFSNAGFIGIPLVQAAFGAEAVFFIAPFIAALNVLQWTYGRWRISGSTESISMRSVLSSPMLIALILGTVLFLVRMPIPPIAQTLMGTIANLNSPLAMLILGSYLANADLRTLLTTPKAYQASVARLVLIPLVSIALFAVIPEAREVKLAILIAAAAPVGSNVSVFCQQLGQGTNKPSITVCLSTLLSLVTLPLISALATAVL